MSKEDFVSQGPCSMDVVRQKTVGSLLMQGCWLLCLLYHDSKVLLFIKFIFKYVLITGYFLRLRYSMKARGFTDIL